MSLVSSAAVEGLLVGALSPTISHDLLPSPTICVRTAASRLFASEAVSSARAPLRTRSTTEGTTGTSAGRIATSCGCRECAPRPKAWPCRVHEDSERIWPRLVESRLHATFGAEGARQQRLGPSRNHIGKRALLVVDRESARGFGTPCGWSETRIGASCRAGARARRGSRGRIASSSLALDARGPPLGMERRAQCREARWVWPARWTVHSPGRRLGCRCDDAVVPYTSDAGRRQVESSMCRFVVDLHGKKRFLSSCASEPSTSTDSQKLNEPPKQESKSTETTTVAPFCTWTCTRSYMHVAKGLALVHTV